MTTAPYDHLPALLAAAALSADRHRKAIEPHLAGRENAAAKITDLTTQLVNAWRDLAVQSQRLIVVLGEAGIANVPLAHIEVGSLSAAVASELWRLSTGPHPGSPLALPCVCAGQVNRPDMLVPLSETVRAANNLVRNILE
jgi:hypothetical protein